MNRYHFDDKQHLHTLDAKPLIGTSTVLSIVSKPLTWWAAGMALAEFGWTNPRTTPIEERRAAAMKGLATVAQFHHMFDADAYLAHLDKCYRAHDAVKNKAATAGTDMHAELEKYVKASLVLGNAAPLEYSGEHRAVQLFSAWAQENISKFMWSEAHCYSERLWTGGITDCGAELKNGSIAIIDFKSSKEAYGSQFWQIGGYDIEIAENGGFDAEGNLIFEPVKIDCHIVFPFGMVDPKPTIRFDVESNREAFEQALGLYRKQQAMNQN